MTRVCRYLDRMSEFSGVLTAMATPFDDDGDVDFAAAAKLARHLLENGSDGLVVAGSTGEAATLDDTEQIDLLKAVRAEVGEGALLICGTGTNDTRHSVGADDRPPTRPAPTRCWSSPRTTTSRTRPGCGPTSRRSPRAPRSRSSSTTSPAGR